ncbi:hypothetical protein [Actinomyces gerencseriae]|uniref:hypothetical protein n=1 Tax=Actinomyces gerencseriae TaxID=52769 RepID=UPI0023F583F3|nr:hypothetical protein [Actinomyces gerencseriae]
MATAATTARMTATRPRGRGRPSAAPIARWAPVEVGGSAVEGGPAADSADVADVADGDGKDGVAGAADSDGAKTDTGASVSSASSARSGSAGAGIPARVRGAG